jgi:hypothetical protein
LGQRTPNRKKGKSPMAISGWRRVGNVLGRAMIGVSKGNCFGRV